MPPLGESAWCETCGAAYLLRDGHDCRGPRSALNVKTAPALASPGRSESRIRPQRKDTNQ